MAAYAALLSLSRSLHQILNLEQYIDPLHKQKIISLHEKVNSIITFLEDYSEKHRGRTLDHHVGNGFRKAAYEAQDFMDSYLCSLSRTNDSSSSSDANSGGNIFRFRPEFKIVKNVIFLKDKAISRNFHHNVSLDQDLDMAFERINFIWGEVIKVNNDTAEDLRSRNYSSPVNNPSTVKITTRNMVVGFDDDLNAIKERLYEDSTSLQIIPIVGMGGIGKTTLARRAYEDSLLAQYFDICAWITVSAEYQRRDILSRLLQSFKKKSDESDAQLEKLVYQNLMGRRYLIVIDDLWSTKAWDDLKMIFLDDGSGSRILLTTRLSDVAVYAGSFSSSFHQMNFLNEDQSWKLLQKRIFGQESCPLHLVETGKKIAKNCGGLPLTIVVVAGLLISTGNMTEEELWENISENISSREPTIELQCSKILCLSYDRLPLRLKPCFMYITAFPEDFEIDVSNLIQLWVAEGFLKPNDQSECLEDVGARHLEDLVNKSLNLVRKKGPDGKLKTVGIHDLLREICTTKAEEEGFLHHVSSERNARKNAAENPNRRLSIHCIKPFQDWRILYSTVRSVLLFSKTDLRSRFSISCKRLSILDAPKITWPNLSDEISTFINLRYIAFVINDISCPHGFPASISKLRNLETIIAHTYFKQDILLGVPREIWEMPKLRHLIMDTPFRSSYPSDIGVVHESDLQTLDSVIDFRFTEEAIKTLASLKKLKFFLDNSRDNWDDFNFNNLHRLQNLEELQVFVDEFYDEILDLEDLDWPNPSRIWNYAFPINVKKLILKGVPLPWENMTIIGSLPNLEVLQMMSIDVHEVSDWTPIEGQFCRLKYFRSSLDYLVNWEVEKDHFPSLESLILKDARWILEIPCGIGEIDSLQLIELENCSKSLVDSAKRIQEQQQENGNDAFQVLLIKCEE